MRAGIGLLFVASISACGTGPEAAFFGRWRYLSGTKEGNECITNNKINEPLAGLEARIEKRRYPSPELGAQFSGFGFLNCEHFEDGALWWLAGNTTAQAEVGCLFGTMRGAERFSIKATLTLAEQTLTFQASERLEITPKDVVTANCTFTYDARLSYLGPVPEP